MKNFVFFVFLILVSVSSVFATIHGCTNFEAEHPALTPQDRSVAFCGTAYTDNNYMNACADKFHVCKLEEFKANYPARGCDPWTFMTTWGIHSHKRCNSCTQGAYEGNAPIITEPTCINLYDSTHKTFDPHSVVPLSDGKIVRNMVENGTLAQYRWANANTWASTFTDIPASTGNTYFSMFCCSDSYKFNGTQACGNKQAEHPSYTTPARDLALCGGSYTLTDAEEDMVCAENWHICSEEEFDARVIHKGVWDEGTLSSWGEDQKKRGESCPYREGYGWNYLDPLDKTTHFCGDACRKPILAHGDGIAVLKDDASGLVMTPRVSVEDHWIEADDIKIDVQSNNMFTVACCSHSAKSHGSMPKCPKVESSSSSDNKPPMPLWGVLTIIFGMLALICLMIVMITFTVMKKQWDKMRASKKQKTEAGDYNSVDEIDPGEGEPVEWMGENIDELNNDEDGLIAGVQGV